MPYFVIEGQDATGKTTQVEMLAEYLRAQGKEVVVFQEPDGDLPQAKVLRRLVKSREYDLEPASYVLLFTVARLELWRKLAEPVLERDGYVLGSRNWYSTLAYQGYGQGVSPSHIRTLTREVMPLQYYRPQHVVILTLPEDVRLARQKARDGDVDRDVFESRDDKFQWQVNRAYTEIASEFYVSTVEALDRMNTQLQIRKIFGL